jgi:hypothetical protein
MDALIPPYVDAAEIRPQLKPTHTAGRTRASLCETDFFVVQNLDQIATLPLPIAHHVVSQLLKSSPLLLCHLFTRQALATYGHWLL